MIRSIIKAVVVGWIAKKLLGAERSHQNQRNEQRSARA